MIFILSFDTWFESLMLGMRTPLGLQVASIVTFFGNTTTIIGIGGVVVIALWLSKVQRPYFFGLVTTLAGAVASTYVLKEIIARARPGGLIPAIVETGFSFTSWHAAAAVAFYGFVAFFLCRSFPEHKRVISVVTVLLALSIGFSRLYLGVHYPSDVIAGFALGGLWLWAGIWVTNKIQSRFSTGIGQSASHALRRG